MLRGTELGLLVCPRCHGELRQGGEDLRCLRCGAGYAVVDGIPLLVPEQLACPRCKHTIGAGTGVQRARRVTGTSELAAWKVSA